MATAPSDPHVLRIRMCKSPHAALHRATDHTPPTHLVHHPPTSFTSMDRSRSDLGRVLGSRPAARGSEPSAQSPLNTWQLLWRRGNSVDPLKTGLAVPDRTIRQLPRDRGLNADVRIGFDVCCCGDAADCSRVDGRRSMAQRYRLLKDQLSNPAYRSLSMIA